MPRVEYHQEQHRLNFWDSYDSTETNEVRLFANSRIGDDHRREKTNLYHPGTLNNGEEDMMIERWYARADHGIPIPILARTVVTLTMGSRWMRDITMDHLIDRTGDLRGEPVGIVLPIRQYMGVEIRPAKEPNTHEHGRIWIHFVVTPYRER